MATFGTIFRSVKKSAQIHLHKGYNLGPKEPFLRIFHKKFQKFFSIFNV
jgi:hypothetical protein